MWVRSKEAAFAFAFFLMILAFQPLGGSQVETKISLANYKNGDAGLVSIEFHQTYITVDLKSQNSDVMHIPIFSEGNTFHAEGVLRKDSMTKEVDMPLVNEKFRGKPHDMLILDQDWPQNWDKLVILLHEQDWPQHTEVIIPLDFQDWPQSWLKVELA